MPLEEHVGEFSRTLYKDPAGGDFMIGILASEEKILGDAKPGSLSPGLTYRFFGKWVTNAKHGRQFKFDHFIEDEPLTRHAMAAFLMRYGKKHGMTFNRAHALIDEYKSECFVKLREDPAECAKVLKMDPGKLRAFSTDLATMKHMLHSKVELVALFDGQGFPKRMVEDCIELWGGRAATIVKADPFKLLTNKVKGAGFARCDTLYLKLGHPPAKMKRQVLAAWNRIDKQSEGDTWIPMSRAVQAVRESIAAAEVDPMKSLAIGFRSRLLARREFNGVKWVSTYDRAKNEDLFSSKVRRMRSEGRGWPEIDKGSLTDHQFEQLMKAMETNVGILVGTPGTGKTYTAAAAIKQLLSIYSPSAVALCAPTGKAAVRLTEALKQEGVDIVAETIHSLLVPSVSGHGTGQWGFVFNRHNKLPISVLVVDEASMVDTDLASNLFEALPSNCRVLLIGDTFQLPPVGHGAPLRDLVAKNESVGCLAEIHRNAGLIVHGCRSIKDGSRFRSAEKFIGKEDNLVVMHAQNEVESLDRLRDFYRLLRDGGKRDLFEDAQVLTPMNTKGALSRENVAAIIQDIVNPRQPGDPLICKYRPGDKIICTSNDYYTAAEEPGARLYIANGEMGRVLKVEERKGKDSKEASKMRLVTCTFPPLGKSTTPRVVEWQEYGDESENFALGYAITVHKSQGSQWPIVVILADPAAGRVAGKEWWYTGISRASERCLIIGDKRVVEKQSRSSSLVKRKTFLVEHLQGMFDNPDTTA